MLVGAVLIGLGGILFVFTFLLAFTVFGLISGGLGFACIVTGALILGRRSGPT